MRAAEIGILTVLVVPVASVIVIRRGFTGLRALGWVVVIAGAASIAALFLLQVWIDVASIWEKFHLHN